MTVVVADTSPLNYLILIGEANLLHELFTEILVPKIVISELLHQDAPAVVSEWAAKLPRWIRVLAVPTSSVHIPKLDAGEAAAILLAEMQPKPVLLLIDDADGRAEAERRHILTAGTLGVLRAAALRGIVDLPAALALLQKSSFRCASHLVDALLIEDAERKGLA